ncbi:hypothetical protein HELRODRAFT_163426 [Helobdella robusta]|uniref:CUB domain-containing protein n=1 Tax=Helobdella robusta TaxID=6412 RepID=T1EU11_HELRO|nr:hypothetical protein HELRODRAFT_163426 [Helobdella robusta]ESN96368.1 hypothetical protein HELRODRAFT_163426 [Helobdella robusta]
MAYHLSSHIRIFVRCNEKTQSDYVELSNFNVQLMDRKMSRLCHKLPENRRVIISDNNFFRVTFKSNDRFDSTGFLATYEFKKIEGGVVLRRLLTYSITTSFPAGGGGGDERDDDRDDDGVDGKSAKKHANLAFGGKQTGSLLLFYAISSSFFIHYF